MSVTSGLFRAARASATLRAVSRGRIVPRLFNIAVGRLAGRFLGRVWR